MKVQFHTGRLRLRIGHAELAVLLDGGALSTEIAWPGAGWRIEAALADTVQVVAGGPDVHLTLPRDEVAALATRLPSREGLRYALELPSGPLELRLEVDLHDGRDRVR
jgi:hypothetical protein